MADTDQPTVTQICRDLRTRAHKLAHIPNGQLRLEAILAADATLSPFVEAHFGLAVTVCAGLATDAPMAYALKFIPAFFEVVAGTRTAFDLMCYAEELHKELLRVDPMFDDDFNAKQNAGP